MLKKITDSIFGIVLAVLSIGLIGYCALMWVHSYNYYKAGVVEGSCAQTPFVNARGESPRIAADLYVYSDQYATKRIGRVAQFQFFKVIAQSGEMIKVVRYYEQENKDAPSYWVKRSDLELAQHLRCNA